MVQRGMGSSQSASARERVRLALRRRLAELGMTGRAFGASFPHKHGDSWVSGLLRGQFALGLEELDDAAAILKSTAVELVRAPNQIGRAHV